MSAPSEALQKAFYELQQKTVQTQNDLQLVTQQINSSKREIKRIELTADELKKENAEKVWEGVGKMFILNTSQNYVNDLAQEKSQLEDSIKALEKKRAYLETTFENAKNGLNEFLVRAGLVAPN
ncbi:Prefoldin [Nadsonia fulvescens var. elongata DSM 6958]|uniref:Prefoldin n=1 Tax=Nadsonia fulvescens var. elongata DSM 6958 TaxID=857566 RepID=A0A1E3PSK8_9ASCO|nr:Prefoldin [Nadsonia fulvescens var. elongata DSM 6958]